MIVTAAYFPPRTEVPDIVEELAEHDERARTAPVIIYGDFNCRMDATDPTRGEQLEEAMEALGYSLVNDKRKHTYFCQNGASTIDLILTRGMQDVQLKLLDQEIWRKYR